MSAPTATSLLPRLNRYIPGKTILVLGASPNSLGARFLEMIQPHGPSQIIIGTRNPEKIQPVIESLHPIPVKTFQIDMNSFDSVRAAAKVVNDMGNIDVLVNNIGNMATPWTKSSDGWETQLQTGHLGFFLFVNLVIDKIIQSKARVVNVSSEGYSLGPIRYDDPNFMDGEVYNPFMAYAQAKTAQLLFSAALARKLGEKGVLSYSIQPGYTPGTNLTASWGPYSLQDFIDFGKSALGSSFPGPNTVDQSMANFVVAAFDPEINEHNGAYIRDAQVVDPDTMFPWAVDERQERRCWKFSEKLVGQEFAL